MLRTKYLADSASASDASPDMLVLPVHGMAFRVDDRAGGFQGVYVTAAAYAGGVPVSARLPSEQVVADDLRGRSIPVLADADTGCGNALNLMRTIREMGGRPRVSASKTR